jgi:peptidyl-prolyl cis-trans isomerase D
MRRHAQSWLIKFLIGMIAVVFIFYFGYSFRSKEGVRIAYVNGDVITGSEYDKVFKSILERFQRQYGDAWNEKLVDVFDLRNRALQSLIDQKLLSQEAKRIGLDVTEKEIQQEIISYPAFQFLGRFDESRYRSLLLQNRMKPEDFEEAITQDLLQRKVEQFLTTFVPVNDQEILDLYAFAHRKVKIAFVQFLPEKYKESVKIDDKALENYFSEHKERFRVPQKLKIGYIVIDPRDFEDEDTLNITGEEVLAYYEENLERFGEEKQVRARHILFKLGPDASEDDVERVRQKALTVLERARKGEDFTRLAREYSEGPTREKDGDLGYFSRGKMLKPFDEAAFNMEKGQIGDLVRTSFGYHIIKIEDVKESRTRTLEEVQAEIEDILVKTRSTEAAHEKALSLLDQMPYDVNLQDYASAHKVTFKRSEDFSQDEPIPEIGGDVKTREMLFSLDKNDVTNLIESGEKFYIIQVMDKEESHLPEFRQVYDRVREDYAKDTAFQEARSAAEAYLYRLRAGEDWGKMAEESGITPHITVFFTRNDPVPQIGNLNALTESAFALSEQDRYPDQVFQNERGVFVIRWEDQEDFDREKYEENKESFRSSWLVLKHQTIYRVWLENLKKNAEIDIVYSFREE